GTGSASLQGLRRRTATCCARSSAYRGGGRFPPRSGRSREKTPLPVSSRRPAPARGADGSPRPAHSPRARVPYSGTATPFRMAGGNEPNTSRARRRPEAGMEQGTVTTQPHGQSFIIKRPRLTKLLDESGARIILLLAPAGYGKTTLAREWVAGNEGVVWYSGKPAMADVTALATALAAALVAD